MKTSVIEVHDMLSVFSVDEVEKRIGEVPGVESVTVNHAAGQATVRFDETRLAVTDIKSAVRQRGFDSATPPAGHPSPGAAAVVPATKAPAVPMAASADTAKTATAQTGTPDKAPVAKPDKAGAAAPVPTDSVKPAAPAAASADTAKQGKATPDAPHQH